MKQSILGATLIASLAGLILLVGCSDTQRASKDAYYGDKPALITCSGYNGPMVETTTTGRIEYDDGGRYTFVDAKTGGLVITEGECVIRYAR